MNRAHAQAVQLLEQVAFPGYTFNIVGTFEPGTTTYLQAHFMAPDNDAPGTLRPQATRKWLLSQHMTRSELVQTCLKCVLTAVEHEARELFTYRGERVFGPHLDVDTMAVLLASNGTGALDVRGEPA